MVWSFLAPFAWSPAHFGNLCVHHKVMSEIELWLWLFFTRETCQVRHSQSRRLFSLNSRVPWEELVNQRTLTAAEAHRVSQGEDRAIQNVLICSPIQTIQRKKQTTGCNERKTNTWLWQFWVFFFLSVWFDLIWSVYKSPLFKEKMSKNGMFRRG